MTPRRRRAALAAFLAATSLVATADLAGSPTASAAPLGTEVSRAAGIFERTLTWGAYVHDFDGDGWEDVLVNRHYGDTSRLYRNDGGVFREVHKGTFGLEDRHDCAWSDVNRDGRSDVYCTLGGVRGGTAPNPNELWLQQPDGGFVNRAVGFRVHDRYGRGRAVAFLDVNRDGLPDLYVGNAVPRRDGRRGPNRLFINVGGKRFRSPPPRSGRYGAVTRPIGGEVVQAADYDGDGWEDLLVCGKRRLYLFRNDHGRFRNVSRRTGVDRPCISAQLTTVNRGPRLDLVRATHGHLAVNAGRRGGFKGTAYHRRLRTGIDLAAGDIDGDRRQDLYVVQGRAGGRERVDLMLRNRIHRPSGPAFKLVRIPQTRRGSGDAVAAIDYDRNGRSDFIVMNGHRAVPGPIRLVAFR